jgi:hypothetical protein
MMLLIPKAKAQELLDYLVSRPYREVHHLVDSLMNLQSPAQGGATSVVKVVEGVEGVKVSETTDGGNQNGRG